MVCQKLNFLSFADKKQSRRSDRMTLGAFLMTYFTLRKCSFGHPRRSMRTSASVDADQQSATSLARRARAHSLELTLLTMRFPTRADVSAVQ